MNTPILTKLAGKLSTSARNSLPAGAAHQGGAVEAKVDAAVHRKYPDMGKEAAYKFGAQIAAVIAGIRS